MPTSLHVPPGRAGRLWLRRRLVTAERGRDQLDRRLRVLLPELQRRSAASAREHEHWERACAELRRWTTRVALLGGQDALRHAATRHPATVELRWAVTMGVHFPAEATVTTVADRDVVADNAAVAPAVAAAREALAAAARAAVADEAVRRITTEIDVTRRRLHALEKRWLPWLTATLAELELAIEQAEHEDGVRLRRAAGRRASGRL